MKILVDMNLSPQWEDILGKGGYDAKYWSRLGAATAPDTAIMEYARKENMIVFTPCELITAITQHPPTLKLRRGPSPI